jgi:hypothetical protein
MAAMSPRRIATVVAAFAALLAPATATAEIRNGSTGAGILKPDDPDVRIKRASISYDTNGILSGTLAVDGQLQDKDVSMIFSAGTYTRKRECKDLPDQPYGAVGGITGTFSLPPQMDPTTFLPPATRMAFYDGDSLGMDGVTYSASGATATTTATIGLFANRGWNCGWVSVYDNGLEGGPHDKTSWIPLGNKAIKENKRLLRKRLKSCDRRRSAAKRSACRAKAREFYGVTP